MTRKEVTLQKRRCDSCRYKHRTCMERPCRDGIMQIIFEGICREYQPDIWTRLRYRMKGKVK